MAGGVSSVLELLWDDSFWFPENITWDTLDGAKKEGYVLAEGRDLLMTIPICICLLVIRYFYERYPMYYLGKYLGIPSRQRKPAPAVPELEKLFRNSSKPSRDKILEVCKKLDYSERYVEWWFRHRRIQNRPTTMKKFTETGWRFTYYFAIFIYGCVVLYDKPWLTDTMECWVGFPRQTVTPEMYWYYMIEMGFYNSLVVSYIFDVKRKDFVEQMIHHIATIFLISFSWFANFVRMGTLVLLLHDTCDYWLEGAKMAVYSKKKLTSDILFAVFTILWFITRITLYPLKILNSTWYEGTDIHGDCPAAYLFNIVLLVLQVLHIFWFYAICKAAFTAITKGAVEDSRSDSEEEEEEAPGSLTDNSSNGSLAADSSRDKVSAKTTNGRNGTAQSVG